MELWIRSQDKEILIKVDRIGIEEFDNGYGIVTYVRIGTKNEFGLGLYQTKERALEVLDEIQNILNPQKKLVEFYHENFNNTKEGVVGITAYKEDDIKIEQFSTFVYEMPKE